MFSKKSNTIDEDYVKDQASKIEDKDVKVALNSKEAIADKILNSNILKRYSELAKVMFDMLKDYRRGVYSNVPWFTIASIAFALLYVLNPFDLIPDFIPGIGYLDDFAVFTFALRFIETDLHEYLDWKLEDSKE